MSAAVVFVDIIGAACSLQFTISSLAVGACNFVLC